MITRWLTKLMIFLSFSTLTTRISPLDVPMNDPIQHLGADDVVVNP